MRKTVCQLCGQPSVGRGLCRRHYQAEWKSGNLGRYALNSMTALDRLRSHTSVSLSGCWEWTGQTRSDGYGMVWYEGKAQRAHRVSYLVHKGYPPEAPFVLCHTCDNRLCINPDHLFEGTRGENCTDAASKNRFPVNNRHWNTRLSPANVATIRASDAPNSELARQYAVNQSTISRIRSGQRRRHVSL